MYIGGYGGLSDSGLCVFRKLCQVSFLGACPSALLWSRRMLIVMMIVRVELSTMSDYIVCKIPW